MSIDQTGLCDLTQLQPEDVRRALHTHGAEVRFDFERKMSGVRCVVLLRVRRRENYRGSKTSNTQQA